MAAVRYHQSERVQYYSPERLRRMIAQEIHAQRKHRKRRFAGSIHRAESYEYARPRRRTRIRRSR